METNSVKSFGPYAESGLLMTSFALQERPKSRRARYPKVRTGCISCKKRHVKCDEAKPSCQRCLKWSGACSGYAPAPSKCLPSPKTTTKEIARPSPVQISNNMATPVMYSSSSESASVYSPASTTPTTPLLRSPIHSTFSAANQGGIRGSTTSVLDASFWTETVPRLIRDDLAVHYANMAVHVLIFHKQPELIPQDAMDGFALADHYSQALAHYGYALRQVQQSLKSGGLHATILCSMFFAIFEAISEDAEAAESHIFSGQRMMNELHALMPNHEGRAGAGSLRQELKHLLHYISLQVRTGAAEYLTEKYSIKGCLKELTHDSLEVDDVLCDPALYTDLEHMELGPSFSFDEFVEYQ